MDKEGDAQYEELGMDPPANWWLVIGGWIVCILASLVVWQIRPTTGQPLSWCVTNFVALIVIGAISGALLSFSDRASALMNRIAAKTSWVYGLPFMLVWIYVSEKILFSTPELVWYKSWAIALGSGCFSGVMFTATFFFTWSTHASGKTDRKSPLRT